MSSTKLSRYRGHYTIEACPLYQLDAHLRAIFELPTPEGNLTLNRDMNAILLNILGVRNRSLICVWPNRLLSVSGAKIQLYGGREMRCTIRTKDRPHYHSRKLHR